jgi:hypothetical protein
MPISTLGIAVLFHGSPLFLTISREVLGGRCQGNARLKPLGQPVVAPIALFEKQEVKGEDTEAGPDGDDMGDTEGAGARGLCRIIRMRAEEGSVFENQPCTESQPRDEE